MSRTPIRFQVVFFVAGSLALAFARSGLAADPDSSSPQHTVLAAGNGKVAIVNGDGRLIWEMKNRGLHDLQLLPNGNILLQTSPTVVAEIDQNKKTVWSYDSGRRNGNQGQRVEVHAFQRLPDGLTMIAESGPGRIIEVDRKGTIKREVKLSVERPNPHRDTRLVRKLASGNYLVCHEGDGRLREYDAAGKIVWEYNIPLFGKEPKGGHGFKAFGNQAFGALRLANGNTLLTTGNGHSVLEVTRDKKIVWKIEQNDLPGIQLAWTTTLEQLPNGNIVFGNCHAGPDNPQLIEVTREKKVVWTFQNFKLFGNNMSNSQLVDMASKSRR